MSTCVVASHQNFPKRAKKQYFRTKNPEHPENADNAPERLARRRAAFELQCFRNCTFSSFFFLSLPPLSYWLSAQTAGLTLAGNTACY